jgi:hypothetical protein
MGLAAAAAAAAAAVRAGQSLALVGAFRALGQEAAAAATT